MIWQNPWAWLGLGAIALPVLIHLLGRGRARIHRFPTLRFLEASQLLPSRRTRVHDPLLLAIRVGVLASAVTALAQPLVETAHRAQAFNAGLARVIIVDTSASMSRSTPGGERAVDAARREASRVASDARFADIVETAEPTSAIPGAVAWLRRQPARREMVVVSDFQIGTLDSGALVWVPRSVGLRMERVGLRAQADSITMLSFVNGRTMSGDIAVLPAGTTVGWALTAGSDRGAPDIAVLASDRERGRADAAIDAAGTIGVRLPMDTAHLALVTIVEPDFERTARRLQAATPPTSAWMIDVAARLRADSALQRASAGAATIGADSVHGLAVVRDASGRPVVVAAQDAKDPRRLLLVSAADAGSLASAMLVASVRRALSNAPRMGEFEPTVVPEGVLASWQRAPGDAASDERSVNPGSGESDGRWFWGLALVLLGAEWLVRRRARGSAPAVEGREHAA